MPVLASKRSGIEKNSLIIDVQKKILTVEKKIAWIQFSENSNHWRESLLQLIRQNIAGWCQQIFCFQKFVDNAQQCFAFTPEANFPAHDLNFHWRWWDRIYLLKYFLLYCKTKIQMKHPKIQVNFFKGIDNKTVRI